MAAYGRSLVANAVATGPLVAWPGGRTALVIFATTFPTTTKLQMLAKDGVTFIDILVPTVNAVIAFDAPPGSYRIQMTAGAPAAVYADLVHIPYN